MTLRKSDYVQAITHRHVVAMWSLRDLSEEEFSKINKRMDSKRDLYTSGGHISIIKTVLRRLSGTLKASPMDSAARYNSLFGSIKKFSNSTFTWVL